MIILYDDTAPARFGPIAELRSPSEVRAGALRLEEKHSRLSASYGRLADRFNILEPLQIWEGIQHQDDEPILLLDSRAVIYDLASLEGRRNALFRMEADSRLLGMHIPAGSVEMLRRSLASQKLHDIAAVLPVHEVAGFRYDYPWEIVERIGLEIRFDFLAEAGSASFELWQPPADVIVRGLDNVQTAGNVTIGPGAIVNAESGAVRIEPGVSLGAGAIIDASQGPVWLDREVRIESGAILSGPLYIGPRSIIRPGARLNSDIALGPQCRVGGELSGVVMQGYANKQHSGYLGSSFVGEWVNLGAGTDNSDLKNNYRPVEVTFADEIIETGSLHAGVFIGDYVRTAIGTRLNTGSAIGTCGNLFGMDFPGQSLPPFIWYASNGYQEYRLDKALETIGIVMSRRGSELSDDRRERLARLFDVSRELRSVFLARVGKV